MTPRLIPALVLLSVGCDQETGISDIVDDVDPGTEIEVDTEVEIPEVPRFYFLEQPSAPAVSHEGTVLITNHETGGDVYVWTEDEGLEWVTTTGAWFNTVTDISADGTIILGETGNYENDETAQAATWTRQDGWTKLGALPDTLDCPMQSAGYGLSDDGQVAAGLAFSGCSGRAFTWSEATGFVGYEALGNGGNRASRISGDGTRLVGFAQGNGGRTPAMWDADGTGTVLDMRFPGEFHDINHDGTLAVGRLGSKAFRWREGIGHEALDTLGEPGESTSTATRICGTDDGYILGRDSLAGGQAFIWDESEGIRPLYDFLEGKGMVFPDGARLLSVQDCSPDMTLMTGMGTLGPLTGIWIAILPEHTLLDPTD